MTRRPLIAYYAPMEAASSSVASGVGRVGALMQRSLEVAEFDVVSPELPRCYDGQGDPGTQRAQKAACEAAAVRLLEVWEREGNKPVAWFTYHPYYKSPDWIGPIVSRRLGIPYCIAEASHAPKRENGPWALGHQGAVSAICAADIILASTALDEVCLKPLLKRSATLIALKPFIDPDPFFWARSHAAPPKSDKVRALTVAMMRHPRKRESFRILEKSWRDIDPDTVELRIVGDGPLRPEIEQDFQGKSNVSFLGSLPAEAVAAAMAGADIFLWPGFGEAYGITYLEAQAAGLPVVAQHHRGVPDVISDGVSGILTSPDDQAAYTEGIRKLVSDPGLRGRMSCGAQDYVRRRHTLAQASNALRAAILPRLTP